MDNEGFNMKIYKHIEIIYCADCMQYNFKWRKVDKNEIPIIISAGATQLTAKFMGLIPL